MWSEPFSRENLKRIFDYENRKGVFIEKEFFPEVYKETEEIKKCNIELTTPNLAPVDEKRILDEKIGHLQKKEELLNNELDKVSRKLTSKEFKITLRVAPIKGTNTYLALNNVVNFFAIRQLQYNFQRFYKVKQSSSFSIVSQVTKIFSDQFPKYIIRTDITAFYESIPHKGLLKKVQRDNLLDIQSKLILSQILSEYERLSGSTIGIPRGIGVSAYLAELYMRDFDEKIKVIPNLFYYARYVDDIIAIFVPQSTADPVDYLNSIDKILTEKELVRNQQKTFAINLINNSTGRCKLPRKLDS